MDVHSKKTRSYNMSRIKGKDTKPEKIIRQWLWHNGYRYRLHDKEMPGKPDIIFTGRRKVIFVHGCFWHKHNCKYFKWPENNAEFWKKKIEDTVLRDRRNYKKLNDAGWDYMLVWECETKGNEFQILTEKIRNYLNDKNHPWKFSVSH